MNSLLECLNSVTQRYFFPSFQQCIPATAFIKETIFFFEHPDFLYVFTTWYVVSLSTGTFLPYFSGQLDCIHTVDARNVFNQNLHSCKPWISMRFSLIFFSFSYFAFDFTDFLYLNSEGIVLSLIFQLCPLNKFIRIFDWLLIVILKSQCLVY